MALLYKKEKAIKAAGNIMKRRAGERGVALILALMVLLLLTIMAMGALYTASRGILHSRRRNKPGSGELA